MSSIATPEVLPETEISAQEIPTLQEIGPPAIGPLWMTAGICLLFVVYTMLGTIRRIAATDSGDSLPHFVTYGSQILGIWLLLAATLATVYHRRTFLRESLLNGARPWRTELARGFAVFAIFLVCTAVVRSLFHSASHNLWPFTAANHLIQRTDHQLSLEHSSAVRMGPTSAIDLLLWIFVSMSAGVCEELIFRGYLLRQCIAALRRFALSQNGRAAVAVVLTSMLFGAVHLYEGAGSALTIGFLGATYAVAALRFRNLRAVVVAHSLQDVVFGVVTYFHHLVPR